MSLDSAAACIASSLKPNTGSKANTKSPTFKSPVTSYCSKSKLRTFLTLDNSLSITSA